MKKILIILSAILLSFSTLFADEGFWTFDALPEDILKDKYNFEATPEWVETVQKASVRFNNGGSAAFVSPHGLVLTNYHVGMDLVQKISTPAHDYIRNGFLARSYAAEIPAPDLEVNILMSILDVTDRVKAAAESIGDPAEKLKALKSEMARIEKEENEATGLRCNVITLYHGGVYKLFRYQKHTDVRLVFAPEQTTVFFGGKYDNYTYPRYSLDCALFRVYENGEPLQVEHYLPFQPAGAADGELVFISGNPGFTDRSNTIAQVEFDRDISIPLSIRSINSQLNAIYAYAATSAEANRQVQKDINSLENIWKRYHGWQTGLQDTALFNPHVRQEERLRRQIAANPEWQAKYGKAWDNIAVAYNELTNFYLPRYCLGRITRQSLVDKALTIVQLTTELNKPNEDRLEEYRDSNLESLEWDLYSPAPIYVDKEIALFRAALEFIRSALGSEDDLIQRILAGKSESELPEYLFQNTALLDPEYRRSLVAEGFEAVEKSTDPLIEFARHIDPVVREYRQRYEDTVESVTTINGALIAEARFMIYGTSIAPDANFTPRLSFGVVKGYEYNGTRAPYQTTLYGMFDRAHSFDHQPPFALPAPVAKVESQLNMATPYNFVYAGDTVGGNSGSPVINTKAELVGLHFDGNMEKIIINYIFTDETARGVAVHPAIILEFLDKVYDADRLVQELLLEK